MPKASLKVLSYNIHKGFTQGNREFVLDRIRTAIRATKAEVVFLQEVLGGKARTGSKIQNWVGHQFEYLADNIWPHFAYGKNAVYDQGHHGNAILSLYPIRRSENIDISVMRYVKRGLLHAVIEAEPLGTRFHAMCLHLDLLHGKRAAQAKLLGKRMRETIPAKDPVIIAGDFNDWSEKLVDQMETQMNLKEAFFESQGAHARTFPAKLPTLKLDRIYYRGFKVTSTKCYRRGPWIHLSDHLPITARFQIDY